MARSKSTLLIRVLPANESRRETQQALAAIDRGKAVLRAQPTYTFHTIGELWEMLTPNRWALLEGLLDRAPLSLRALARKVGRDVRGVHTDVHRLLNCGLVERTETGQLRLFGSYDAEPEVGISANRITQIHVDFTVHSTEGKEAA